MHAQCPADVSRPGIGSHARQPDSTLVCRFQWVLQYLAGAGFYVIPAYQPADNSADNTVVSTPAIFLRNWANLWASISDLPSFNAILKVCQTEGSSSILSLWLRQLGVASLIWYVRVLANFMACWTPCNMPG